MIDIDNIHKDLINLGTANTNILAIYLLGSVIRKDFKESSDIDVALMLEDDIKLSYSERYRIVSELTDKWDRKVDLGILSSRHLIYTTEAIFKGNVVFKKDDYKADNRAATLVSMFFQLNIDRKEILNAYRA